MAISFTSSSITIIGGDYTFEDIYQASLDEGNTQCEKLGSSYIINSDLIIGDEETETTLTAENISVTILGDLFQIKKYSEVYLGTIDNLGSTGNGVYISCPNIANAYGFGSNNRVDDLTQSGNLFAYASTLDIYGFWGFFGGPSQHCEIINCNVNGFGRIEGSNSILKNITTTKSNGRFGVLAPKGIIKEYKDVRSLSVEEYSDHTCSVYFNPAYAPGMRVTGGVFDGYTEGLLYAEANDSGIKEEGNIRFIDADIRNGYGAYWADDQCSMEIAYTFNPTFRDENNNILSEVNIEIYNNDGELIFQDISIEGEINIELLSHYEDYYTSKDWYYYDVHVTYNDITTIRRYEAGKTYIDFPFFIIETSQNNIDFTLEDIQEKIDILESNITTKLDIMENNTQNFYNTILEWIIDSNYKISDILKRWIKRGL